MRMDVLTSSDAYLAAEDPIMPAPKVIHSNHYKHLGYTLAHKVAQWDFHIGQTQD